MVEFVPKADLNPKRVLDLLKMDPPEDASAMPKAAAPKRKMHGDGWEEKNMGDEQTLNFQNDMNDDLENDLFTQRMLEWLET